MSKRLPDEVSDGNGGTFPSSSTSDHDLIILLHAKVDQVLIPIVRSNEDRLQKVEERVARILGAAAAIAFIVGIIASVIVKVHT